VGFFFGIDTTVLQMLTICYLVYYTRAYHLLYNGSRDTFGNDENLTDVLGVLKKGRVMLSIRAMAHGDGYLNYLEKESPGQWVGTGAKILKLDGEVSKEDFHSVRKGLHPETQEKLRIRNVVDRIYNKPLGTGNLQSS
jgi:hypothetical protein